MNAGTHAWTNRQTHGLGWSPLSMHRQAAGHWSSFLLIGFPPPFCPLCWRQWTLFVIYILITLHGLSELLESWRGWQTHRCLLALRLCNYGFIWSCDLLLRLMGCFSDYRIYRSALKMWSLLCAIRLEETWIQSSGLWQMCPCSRWARWCNVCMCIYWVFSSTSIFCHHGLS